MLLQIDRQCQNISFENIFISVLAGPILVRPYQAREIEQESGNLLAHALCLEQLYCCTCELYTSLCT